jgi:putative restriction endonuclease
MPKLELERSLRGAVFAWLDRLRARTGGPVSYQDLLAFEFNGVRVPLLNPARRGIHRPAFLGSDGAALALLTAAPVPGRSRPYDDGEADDADYWIYKFQRDGTDAPDNRYVRSALRAQLPLVYFRGIAKGIYEAFYPVFVTHEDTINQSFHLAVDSFDGLGANLPEPADVVAARRYATRAARVRLHQAQFRENVLTAYVDRCTVCRIKHRVLLDAAHIIPDSQTHGVPSVTNGLSLCKIHHAAYDAQLLSISPEYTVVINTTLLTEVDGPMLRYGLVERHNEGIFLPPRAERRPDRDRLAERHALFLKR